MKKKLLDYLCCPYCRDEGELALTGISSLPGAENEEVNDGTLNCRLCNRGWPISNSIPRFVAHEDYAENFGLQWNRYKRTQLDKFSGLTISRDRFFKVTQWPKMLQSELILDAGCGAGRFTEAALSTGAEVIAFDLSGAVDANLENNKHERLHIIQADIRQLPLKRVFDRIYCLGVIQHTPDPRQSFLSLTPLLKPAGEIAIDCYIANIDRKLNFQEKVTQWLRRYTVRVQPTRLMRMVQMIVPIALPIKIALRHYFPLGRKLNMLIPIGYAAAWKKDWKLPYSRMVEWSILETYDGYAPQNDKAQSLEQVQKWFGVAGLTSIQVKAGANGINGTGRAPISNGTGTGSLHNIAD